MRSPCYDHNVGIETAACGRRRSDPCHVGVDGEELLAQEVAASLGGDLVFDLQAGYAGEDISLDLRRWRRLVGAGKVEGERRSC